MSYNNNTPIVEHIITTCKLIQIQINLYVVIICLTIGVLLLYDILV